MPPRHQATKSHKAFNINSIVLVNPWCLGGKKSLVSWCLGGRKWLYEVISKTKNMKTNLKNLFRIICIAVISPLMHSCQTATVPSLTGLKKAGNLVPKNSPEIDAVI
jgi:hypothetical protein